MNHTPGPWKQSGSLVYSEPAGVVIVLMANRAKNSSDAKPLEIWDKGWNEAMPDAALIAAAPELLAALESIKGLLKNDYAISRADRKPMELPEVVAIGNVLESADKAIAKARGSK